MKNFEQLQLVEFPKSNGLNINMMPFIFGDVDSLPREVHGYLPLIDAAKLKKGSVAYLTIDESEVLQGRTQRRPGIHTDGTSNFHWGGGGWGGSAADKGIYIASNNGRTRVWDMATKDVGPHGELFAEPDCAAVEMNPNTLYWITDRTPHEALVSLKTEQRQFFRLVADEIGIWWQKHSTANPFGVQPNCKISLDSKFN